MICCLENKFDYNAGTCLRHVSSALTAFGEKTKPGRDVILHVRPFQEIILLSGVFRRETASGFYPWGKGEGPRKRVAEGLCCWRHGNSFPMTQSAQSHRQMRGILRCPKAVFYVFVLVPSGIFHRTAPTCWGGEIKKRKSVGISFFCSRDEGIRTLDLCNVTAAL